jgi:hypothetical protein
MRPHLVDQDHVDDEEAKHAHGNLPHGQTVAVAEQCLCVAHCRGEPSTKLVKFNAVPTTLLKKHNSSSNYCVLLSYLCLEPAFLHLQTVYY